MSAFTSLTGLVCVIIRQPAPGGGGVKGLFFGYLTTGVCHVWYILLIVKPSSPRKPKSRWSRSSKRWRQKHPERYAARGRAQYEKEVAAANVSPESIAAYLKKKRDAHKRWRDKNPQKARAGGTKWRKNNREKINAKQRRYLQNPVIRVLYRHRWRINAALKRVGVTKAGKTVDLLGCTALSYKEYLENLFQLGMSWENRNLWQIDHIVAVSKFDLSTKAGQRAAFHYLNTQPLWTLDNLRKGARELQVADTSLTVMAFQKPESDGMQEPLVSQYAA